MLTAPTGAVSNSTKTKESGAHFNGFMVRLLALRRGTVGPVRPALLGPALAAHPLPTPQSSARLPIPLPARPKQDASARASRALWPRQGRLGPAAGDPVSADAGACSMSQNRAAGARER